jgi:predicted outer membrane protein
MSFKKLVSSSICTVVLCTAVSAQESKPTERASQQSNANQETGKTVSHAMVTPQQLASCWALDNQEEVILAKFAQEKSKNKEVDAFAKMISEEHQSCLKKLSKYAPEESREGYLTANTPSGPSDTANPNQNRSTTQTATTGRSTSGIDMTQLHREIALQCISDSKEYLSKKDGNDFDKCFVGMQIAKHAAMHTKLVVLQRHTTDEMQQMISEGIQATAKHLKAAETLMARLDEEDSDTSSKSGK